MSATTVPTTPAAARHWVIGSVITTGLLASVEAIGNGDVPPVRIIIGGIVVAALLSALSEVSPRLAAGFAILIMLSAIFTSAPRTWATIQEGIAK